MRLVGTHLGLKAEYIGKDQWSGQAQDADSLARAGEILDV